MSQPSQSVSRTSKKSSHIARLVISFIALAILSGDAPAVAQRMEYTLGDKVVSKEAYDLFLKGQEYLHANNNADAITNLSKVAELVPDFAEVHNNLGVALAKSGQSAQAIQELEKAVSLSPNLDAAWMSLGGMLQSTGNLDRAIETYKIFLSKFPTHREYKKIAGLVGGLEAERAKERMIRPADGVTNDYYSEVTREGILRWPQNKMPLKVFITNGEAVPNYRPQFADLLTKSFESWSQASNGLVTFAFVDAGAKADIICSWSNEPAKFKNIAESGQAVLEANRTGLVRGTITILTVPLVPALPVTDNRMRRTCLHEIGHAMGLAGHTANPDDAMFHTMGVADTWIDLTERDSNTIMRLYSGQAVTPAQTRTQ